MSNALRIRKIEILTAAVQLAEAQGLTSITREAIATRANVSTGAVNQHFGTMKKLRRAVVGEAIRSRSLRVIGQALAVGDPRAQGAPEELRRAAALSLVSVGE